MAVFKSLPNYEYSRPGIYVHFNGEGIYETNDGIQIAILEKCKPFIQRIDKEEEKAVPVKPKSKATASKKK